MACDMPLWVGWLVAAVGLVSPLLVARIPLSHFGGGTRPPGGTFQRAGARFCPLAA
jgi:hypothetical protein